MSRGGGGGRGKQKSSAFAEPPLHSGSGTDGSEKDAGAGEEKQRKKKRTEAEVREDHLAEGAHLLGWTVPPRAAAGLVVAWQKIERYGFKVDRTIGCITPVKSAQFQGEGRSGVEIASPLAPRLFLDRAVDPSYDGKTTPEGWQLREQYSHLCHYRPCCNPLHIWPEAQWKNSKRNYCSGPVAAAAAAGGGGGGAAAACECGQNPPCLRKYHAPRVQEAGLSWVQPTDPDLRQALDRAFGAALRVKILPRNNYRVQDQQRKNRAERIKKRKSGGGRAGGGGSAGAAAAEEDVDDDDDDFEPDPVAKKKKSKSHGDDQDL